MHALGAIPRILLDEMLEVRTQLEEEPLFLHVPSDSSGTLKNGSLVTFALRRKPLSIHNKLASVCSLVSKASATEPNFLV